jgi:hypothetical protein
MQQPSNSSKPPDVPLFVRIMPTRSTLWTGFAASFVLMAIFGWLAHETPGQLSTATFGLLAGLSALGAVGSGLRLLLQLPIIEASELGIAVWLYGPYRRPFFAPWSRVRAVALTRVRGVDASIGNAARDALGIELNDERFDVPRTSSGEVPVDGAAPANLAWSSRLISGDPRRWVALLQAMKKAYANSPK